MFRSGSFIKIILPALLVATTGINAAPLLFSGTVRDLGSKEAVEGGTVVIRELKFKARLSDQGTFILPVEKPGTYTIVFRVAGRADLVVTEKIDKNTVKNYFVELPTTRAGKVRLYGDRDIQTLSRNTLTRENIKDIAGGFNDPIQSLRTLPGVSTTGGGGTGGLFGTLVIRGANPNLNLYLIDDIPILNAQHFGGFHAVVPVELLKSVDLYSSSYPAHFGFASGGVISFNTIDSVKEFGTIVDVNAISGNAIIKVPINFSAPGTNEKQNAGYWMIGGRKSYIDLFLPVLEKIQNTTIDALPRYWDYQAKAKYDLTQRHSMRLLAFGSRDTFILNTSPEAAAARAADQAGADPLTFARSTNLEIMAHSQGLYYDYIVPEKFSNTLMGFSSLTKQSIFDNRNNAAYNVNITVRRDALPNVFGIQDTAKFYWLNTQTFLQAGAELRYFDFSNTGQQILNNNPAPARIDFDDPTSYRIVPYSNAGSNRVIGGHIENKLVVGGLTFLPGVRANYLDRNRETTVDPRGLLSYEFESATKISVAGGQYSQFVQTNPNYFQSDPTVSMAKEYTAEKAWHGAAGFEQSFSGFSIKSEFFYNYFFNQANPYTSAANVSDDGTQLTRINSGKSKNFGFELTLKKADSNDGQGFFGWINYTYTNAKLLTGVPNQSYANMEINSQYQQYHNFKLVGGYRHDNHTISWRLEAVSSSPYTTIVDSKVDAQNPNRYIPVNNSVPNTATFDPFLLLNMRYTYRNKHHWGEASFYFEILNMAALFYHPKTQQRWYYNQPYGAGNPEVQRPINSAPFIPNFGVEIKF
jgi:TonB-dependent Receptor Plug Domain